MRELSELAPGQPHPVQVAALDGLSPAQVRRWQEMYERTGTRVHQSPAYARAVSAAGSRVVVAMGSNVAAAFACGATACSAIGGDEPALSEAGPRNVLLMSVVTAVRQATGLPVYLPLVGERYAALAAHHEYLSWQRPPNSVIDWTSRGSDLWDRARERGTSQLDRKRRLVERYGLVLEFAASGEAAVRDMLAVDDRSWKAARGQSMRQRGNQSELYGRLLRDGTVCATFLRDGAAPVAFRLDSRTSDRVTCLKWSYDESYRRYSPGVYLLTEGLTRTWSHHRLRVVDLFGGPDTLKDLLHTHRVPRVDVWCGDPVLGAERARDRLALDERVRQARDDGGGLRHAVA
jgi:hypothetical protein